MRHSTKKLLLGAIALPVFSLALTGCTVGPDYARPKVEQPAAFKSPATTQPATSIPTEWWRLYNDPQLDGLIKLANESNQDIRQAIARVDEARALARIAATSLLPTIDANPNLSRVRTSANAPSSATGRPAGTSAVYNNWQIPFDLNYEIDVWGRVRRSVEASKAQIQAGADDLAVVRLTVTSDIATFYYILRALDAQVQILEQTVAAFAEQVRVVDAQLRNGLVSPIDLYQAQSLYEATRAQLADTQRARANAEHALAVICGQPAPTFSVAVRPLQEASPPTVPVGLPGDLLKRRPDVAMAEQNVVSFNAQVGVATAELYPTFTLTGAAGFESANLSHLLDWKSRMFSIGPSISIPIFDAGRRRYNLAAVKAQYQESVAAYVSSVLSAYADVEDALTDLHALTNEVERMRAAVTASQNYLKTALAQYKQGLVTYLVVIDAQRTLLSNQLTLTQDINQQMAASIHLIKALGGGWAPDAGRPPHRGP
jgi:outer membrane protein, multidrug efflux system